MAEAIAALSLAGTIVQFIDFGGKVLFGGLKLYKNRLGSSALSEMKDTKIITESLQRLIEKLNQPLEESGPANEGSKLSQTEIDLRDLAAHCSDIAKELLRAIAKVELQGKRGKWDSLRAALKHVLAEERIEKIRQRLDNFRQEVIMHILACFRNDTSNALKWQESALKTLQGRTASIGEDFLRFVEQSNKWQEGYIEDCRRWRKEIIDAIHSNSSSETRSSTMFGVPKHAVHEKLLALLKFEEMEDRHERIAEAFDKTFQWIFHDLDSESPQETRWVSFAEWLASSSSLYWITGKAGSGKSTLIKYVAQDRRTINYLKIWASAETLVTASYFFWNSGTSMQMSQQGLLRSLLHQMLSSCPELTCKLLPERWEAHCLFGDDPNPMTEAELRHAFTLLKNVESTVAKICLFIDGLDEFDGDHCRLVDFIKELSGYPGIKLCVSSRPWLVFEDAFKTRPSLMIQDLTYPDIMHFVTSKFSRSHGFIELRKSEPEYAAQLLKDIAQKSAGVFLWVALVVSSLLDGLSYGDRVSDLQKRLSLLPPDLEKLYRKILDNLDPFYLEHASQLFELVREAKEPPSILCMSLADEELDSVLKRKIAPFDDEEINTRVDIMKRRLNSRCKGLLEVASAMENSEGGLHPVGGPEIHTPPTSTVQYLHSTVKDFLENPKNWKWLMDSRQEAYDPNLALAKSFLGQLKGVSLKTAKAVTLVEKCLLYAWLAQHGRPANLIAVLDGLDRTAGELVFDKRFYVIQDEIFTGGYDPYQASGLVCNWTSIPNIAPRIDPKGLNFLSLATRLGLHEYVAAKAKKGCLVIQNGTVWPLLMDALVPTWCEIALTLPNPFPDEDMLKVLLEQGADPNRSFIYSNYRKITPWEYLLWILQDDIRQANKLAPWLDIVPLFLAHGADPRAITNSIFRSPNVTKSVTYQVGDALNDYLRSSKDWFNWGLNLWWRCEFSATDIEIIKERTAKRSVSFRTPDKARRIEIPSGYWGLKD
ncbi:hypothetical protein L207DRAFT_574642 [Hyaloscypha variabilis F]|uniref:Uncharacterized protein n=1 Tax=Hyaloscypha variabilis (strain UAMH 11265 / GT02V1 / F) TaxID=1149755 RepID=A0A2J6QRG0_HYAVF|nr:hypothetical protein L207DRAFT_574642 [Hyaloscypha variabilis F]